MFLLVNLIRGYLIDHRMRKKIMYFKMIIYDVFHFQNRELQIMRKLEHQNIVKLKYFFYSSGEKVFRFVNFIMGETLNQIL